MSDFCKHGYIGGCRECIGQMPDGKAIEDALRAEVAALEEELHQVRMNWDAALKAELAKRDEPLTEAQVGGVIVKMSVVAEDVVAVDAAIRRVRRGE